MLAVTRPQCRSYAQRARAKGASSLSKGARRVGAFVLAHPGSVALTLLFGGLGAAVSSNALWMQTEHHPAPLFRQAALQPQRPAAVPARKVPEAQPAAPAPAGEDAGAVILPPARPPGLGRPSEQGSATLAKPAPGKHPVKDPVKDPIADLLGGPAPVPPAPIKPGAGKGQTIEKAARPATPVPANDAIAGLIEQTARNH
ncbi:MAG: hypothetical protein ACHQAQ_04015 [Hyphomicrobiales bacterium]